MEIRYIDKKHSNDINIPNEPFPIKGRMKVSYHGDKWNHEEELFPLDEVKEMKFPDENYDFEKMQNYVFIGAYENDKCVGLAILTDTFNSCLYLYDLKVNKDMRHQGIGKKIIKASYEHAIKNGYSGLYTTGQDNNLNACLFYLSCGFEIGGLDALSYKNTKQEGKYDISFYLH